jgi:hypothetical protein
VRTGLLSIKTLHCTLYFDMVTAKTIDRRVKVPTMTAGDKIKAACKQGDAGTEVALPPLKKESLALLISSHDHVAVARVLLAAGICT